MMAVDDDQICLRGEGFDRWNVGVGDRGGVRSGRSLGVGVGDRDVREAFRLLGYVVQGLPDRGPEGSTEFADRLCGLDGNEDRLRVDDRGAKGQAEGVQGGQPAAGRRRNGRNGVLADISGGRRSNRASTTSGWSCARAERSCPGSCQAVPMPDERASLRGAES